MKVYAVFAVVSRADGALEVMASSILARSYEFGSRVVQERVQADFPLSAGWVYAYSYIREIDQRLLYRGALPVLMGGISYPLGTQPNDYLFVGSAAGWCRGEIVASSIAFLASNERQAHVRMCELVQQDYKGLILPAVRVVPVRGDMFVSALKHGAIKLWTEGASYEHGVAGIPWSAS